MLTESRESAFSGSLQRAVGSRQLMRQEFLTSSVSGLVILIADELCVLIVGFIRYWVFSVLHRFCVC